MDILKYCLLAITFVLSLIIFFKACKYGRVSRVWTIAVSLTMAGYLYMEFF